MKLIKERIIIFGEMSSFYVCEILFAVIQAIAKFVEKTICKCFYPYEKCCDQCAEQHHLFAILNFAFYYLQHNFDKFRIHVVKFRFSRNFTYVIHGTMEGRGSRGAVGDGENSGCTLM